MPEQRQQNDDRQWHAQKPKQDTASHTHGRLLSTAIDGFGERGLQIAAVPSALVGHISRQIFTVLIAMIAS